MVPQHGKQSSHGLQGQQLQQGPSILAQHMLVVRAWREDRGARMGMTARQLHSSALGFPPALSILQVASLTCSNKSLVKNYHCSDMGPAKAAPGQ